MVEEEKEDEVERREMNFWVIMNWKKNKYKTRKTEPDKSEIGTYEIPIELSIDVILPKDPMLKAEGEVKLSREKVASLQANQLKS